MISFNRVTGVYACVLVTAAVGTLGFVSLVFGETAIRSDYDRDDYILYMATVIQNDGSKPGLTDDTATGATSEIVRQGVGEPSGLSGSRGDASVEVNVGKNKKLPNPPSYYAITGLGLEERKNNPCLLKLYGTLVDPRYQGGIRVVAEQELERCKHLLGGIDYKDVNFPESEKNFDFTKDGKHFIRKVKVCGGHAGLLPQQAHSHQMWEIKGVKIMASEVKLEDSPALNPAVIELQNIEEFTRANCLNKVEQAAENKPGWSEWSACPTGQVATGVRAYYGNDKYFTGLKLRCKTVASKRIEAFPIKDNIGY
ncbi:MAG: hypothetical protein KC587_15495 [Nitrospira sp.]|nr:hypothetical protein [Nitrospira sp.]